MNLILQNVCVCEYVRSRGGGSGTSTVASKKEKKDWKEIQNVNILFLGSGLWVIKIFKKFCIFQFFLK